MQAVWQRFEDLRGEIRGVDQDLQRHKKTIEGDIKALVPKLTGEWTKLSGDAKNLLGILESKAGEVRADLATEYGGLKAGLQAIVDGTQAVVRDPGREPVVERRRETGAQFRVVVAVSAEVEFAQCDRIVTSHRVRCNYSVVKRTRCVKVPRPLVRWPSSRRTSARV